MTTTTSKWLSGRYAPLRDEVTATDLTVRGALPPELDGRYVRNGPNPLTPPDPATYHWFTGDGMVHGVRLREGRAEWYRNRWVRSTAVSAALGEPPAPGERHGGMDTANTHVVDIGGRAHAVVEAGARPVELGFELDTVCHSDLGGTLPHGFTAHPQRDPATGDLHAVAYHWALPHLQYLVVGSDGRVRHHDEVQVPGSPMVHDCSITERWMVVYDLPVTFALDAAAEGVRFPYRWDEDHGARVGLLPLGGAGSAVRWFEVGPSYVFHPLNAHDDGDRVVLDVVRWERVFDAHRLGPDDAAPYLWRWTLDTTTGATTEAQLSDVPLEFPRVDDRWVGRPQRSAWATTVVEDDELGGWGLGGQLAHVGVDGGVEVIPLGEGRTSGEWVVVPRSDDAPEDDAWLLGLVHDATTDRGELWVVPADDPTAGPEAVVELPVAIPHGFHGSWLPDEPPCI